jgi:signal transduction histidine kinase
MADLVTDLLDVGKIEAGLDATREPDGPRAHRVEAPRLVRPNAERKTIELTAELPETAIVIAEPIRVRQALVNLIDNGIKYTLAGGRVAAAFFAGCDGAESVTIRVTDTGIGIPARDLPHVFDKFYRVKSKAMSGIAGTELGSPSPGPSSSQSAAASGACRGRRRDVHRRISGRPRVTRARYPR